MLINHKIKKSKKLGFLAPQHADELPENEIEAIDRVLNFEKIGRWYDYKISDPVKLTFKEEVQKKLIWAIRPNTGIS